MPMKQGFWPLFTALVAATPFDILLDGAFGRRGRAGDHNILDRAKNLAAI
jgi:hypothetical protein